MALASSDRGMTKSARGGVVIETTSDTRSPRLILLSPPAWVRGLPSPGEATSAMPIAEWNSVIQNSSLPMCVNKIVLMDPSSVSLKQDIRIYGWYLDISVPWSLG